MIEGLEDIHSIADSMANNSKHSRTYFSEVQSRIKSFIDELKGKSNAKLARKVLLVAAYTAVVLDYLDTGAEPSHASWVSDRDAMLQRHDGIIWDIASIIFYVIKGYRKPSAANEVNTIDKPQLLHIVPEESGKNYLDPLVRMPDYLAAAASDMNLNTFEFSHLKLERIGTAPSVTLVVRLINFNQTDKTENTYGHFVNTPFITQSSRREFMPHFGTLTASCHSVSRVVVQCYITLSSLRLFALPHSGY